MARPQAGHRHSRRSGKPPGAGDIGAVGACTQKNFDGPIQTIIPWAGNLYTDTLIRRARAEFGEDFWGFWMLGGMSGGGMGFLFSPQRKPEAQQRMQVIMSETKRAMEHSVPFAMEPVVYNFAINERGTQAAMLSGAAAHACRLLHARRASAVAHRIAQPLRRPPRGTRTLHRRLPHRRGFLRHGAQSLRSSAAARARSAGGPRPEPGSIAETHGFDRVQHEQIQTDLRSGRIGLAQNRLPVTSHIEDAAPDELDPRHRKLGMQALAEGRVAVVTLAGGVGSRWTKGAGAVKALNPFCKLGGRHRNFIETHLAKSLRVGRECGTLLPHIVTTSYLTHDAIAQHLARENNYHYPGPLILSPGRIIGLRMVPMERDLRFAWEEMPQQMLDEQAQKVREGLHAALIKWAAQAGEGSNYTDNLPMQCLHPVGHWYEVPNLLRNGTLLRLLAERPRLNYLLVHNIDTAAVDVDAALLGQHIASGAGLTTEVIARPPGRSRRRTGEGRRSARAWWRASPCPTTNSNRGSPITTAPPIGWMSIAFWRSSA
jgi:hypothetical protein